MDTKVKISHQFPGVRTERGAEAEVRIGENVEKQRLSKAYRHPRLDERLNVERTRRETRLMREARRAGVNVPDILSESSSTIEMERIQGRQAREVIEDKPAIAESIGRSVAALHSSEVVHGDLTTSNVILEGDEVYLIDFGLAERSSRTEDRAVDIHLFRQVLRTSHPAVEKQAWNRFVAGYSEFSESEDVLNRLEDVEQRGRFK